MCQCHCENVCTVQCVIVQCTHILYASMHYFHMTFRPGAIIKSQILLMVMVIVSVECSCIYVVVTLLCIYAHSTHLCSSYARIMSLFKPNLIKIPEVTILPLLFGISAEMRKPNAGPQFFKYFQARPQANPIENPPIYLFFATTKRSEITDSSRTFTISLSLAAPRLESIMSLSFVDTSSQLADFQL